MPKGISRGKGRAVSAALLLPLLAIAARAGNLDRGRAVYHSKCIGCHRKDLKGSSRMAERFKLDRERLDLTSPRLRDMTDKELAALVVQGKGAMPSFSGALSPREIEDVVAYIRSLRGLARGFGTHAKGDVDAAVGEKRFVSHCSYCHGEDGRGNVGIDIAARAGSLKDEELVLAISAGKGRMPAFAGRLPQEEIRAVASHVRSLGKEKK